jgi:hypothetical protein
MSDTNPVWKVCLLLIGLLPSLSWAGDGGLDLLLPQSLMATEDNNPDSVVRQKRPRGEFYPWAGTPLDAPDWQGARRDTLYFAGFQFAGVAALYYLPEDISSWSREAKDEVSWERWRHNVSNPVWDEDKFLMNYVLHPYWGASYYVRGRERGLDEQQAFWFSALNSAVFEYTAEAFFEQVSYTDLIITPLFGWILGESLFIPWRERVRSSPGELDFSDKLLLTATDPLGVLYGGTDKLLGLETSFTMGPMRTSGRSSMLPGTQAMIGQNDSPHEKTARGMGWGMQWRAAW